MISKSIYSCLLLISAQVARGLTTSLSPTPTANPCARISSASARQGATVTLIPSEVYACQQDVPVNKTLVADQIASLKAYLQFQSDLAYLKDPPSSYKLPAVDLLGELDEIAAKVKASGYKSEYDVELDIFQLIGSANDGHLIITPFLIGSFQWATGLNLVSVSPDGIQEPQVYLLDDYAAAIATDTTPSHITSVNGMSIDAWLDMIGDNAPLQDFDAKYNFMMYNPATTFSYGFGTQGDAKSPYYATVRSVYANDSTLYTFSNGTSKPFSNFAVPQMPQLDFNSGLELYEKYLCQPFPSTGGEDSSSLNLHQIPGYPYPAISGPDLIISGYLLDSSASNDTAVLSIPSFDKFGDEAKAFQSTVREFLALAQKHGKSKLIIDVRGNGGGNLGLGKDLFAQLFPSQHPESRVRGRLFPAGDFIGEKISGVDNVPQVNATSQDVSNPYQSIYRAQNTIDVRTNRSFISWQDIATPIESHGDSFTQLGDWDLGNTLLDLEVGIVPTGYDNNTDTLPQAFASENIIILTDGACASTCADFVYTLTSQGNVKSIVAGGRPNKSPMNLIGGVRGAQEIGFNEIQNYAQTAYNLSTPDEKSSAQNLLAPYLQDTPIAMWGGASAQHINNRDSIAIGDESMTPLQYVTEPADCRIFYMAQDIENVTFTWNRIAAGVANGGKGLCINGTVAAWAAGDSNSTTGIYGNSASSINPVSWQLTSCFTLAMGILYLM
ncbi:hypothetical protein K461DRAFT_301681 [Myriangium duriaei CBS 260.36]|uniref:Tail specific protease domain-containing protein n=1 Tax=Myriangium duriaei CBS 260.36 TaxID=1168546 RepID=A0A9P4IYD9_9PEZI|nr:hypothetical protein K461DRAFT_301681 [Myriangium duriaei CBS 260.36]